jgi:hypothetical protein
VRAVVTRLRVWSLSPVGTLLNAAMLFFVLVIAGVHWTRPLLWVAVAIFLGASAYFDVRAYIARRRHGLSAYEAGEVVMDRIWGPRPEKHEEGA